MRARYSYDQSANCIDVTSIPPTTTCEAIIEKIIELVKQGKLKEIADIRDETGLDGLKITIDLKRSVDPEKLMLKLFRMTPLEDTFSCNFNVLIAGVPEYWESGSFSVNGSLSVSNASAAGLILTCRRRRTNSIC